MLVKTENGWEFDWPVRGEDPEAERELRKEFLNLVVPNGYSPRGASPAHGRLFTYPSRNLGRDDS